MNYAMPLDQYKEHVASLLLKGKPKKVPTKHKGAVSFEEPANVEELLAALMEFGLSEDEALAKINISLKQGFQCDKEILKYIIAEL